MMFRLISTAFKIGVASLITGAVLSHLDISAERVLPDVGVLSR